MTDPQELARLFGQFGKAFGRRMCQEMERAGTTPARARLLGALHCQGGCKMSEIGARLGVTPRNVTKLVDALEREGLVARKPHPHDRRATLLGLTDRGTAVCRESLTANHAAVADLFERLTPRDRQQLARILRKLLDAVSGVTG
jgi:DNA-binding MarR family transcriptional regulator